MTEPTAAAATAPPTLASPTPHPGGRRAVRNALLAWTGIFLVACVWSVWPVRVPKWSLPTLVGKQGLRELNGRPAGVLLYTSSTRCGGHHQALTEAVKVFQQLKDDPHFSVKIVYGDLTEQGVQEQARQFPDIPILLDPEKKLAKALNIGAYAVMLYRPSGAVIERGDGKVLYAKPGLGQVLDWKAGLPVVVRPGPSAPEEPPLPHQNLAGPP